MIIENKIGKFPNGFWKRPEAKRDSIVIVKYLIEQIFEWDDEDIKDKLDILIFQNNKLSGMIALVFKNSPFRVINSVYPNRFKPWEINSVPQNYWTLKRSIKAVKWLIERKLKWSANEIKAYCCQDIFIKNKLKGMLSYMFNSSPYQAINTAYPNRFKAWEFKTVHNGYWTISTGAEATKWLIEDKLKWTDKDIKRHLNVNTFKLNGLNGMLNILFNNSPYKAINETYPNRYKPWELHYAPNKYWTLETGINATKWLLEKKLNFNDENIKAYVCIDVFIRNGLYGMLSKVFNCSPYKAINAVYPNKYKPWELSQTPKGYWTLETAILATRWMVDEKLKWTDKDIEENLSKDTFVKYGLNGMFGKCFNYSIPKVLKLVYPDEF